MSKLNYAVIGDDRLGSVDYNAAMRVLEIKKAIARAERWEGTSLSQIELFLAARNRETPGQWLTGDDADSLQLLQRAVPAEIAQAYLRRDQRLAPFWSINKWLSTATEVDGDMSGLHLLVKGPDVARRERRRSDQAELNGENPSPSKRHHALLEWRNDPESYPQLVFKPEVPILRIPARYLADAGVTSSSLGRDLLLFRRRALEEQWNEIQEDTLNLEAQLWIVGAPGAGKSCAAFAFACGVVDRRVWTVVWIHYAVESSSFLCVKFENDRRSVLRIHGPALISDLELLLASLDEKRKTIVFFDGYNTAFPHCQSALAVLAPWREMDADMRRLVCVTSMVSVAKIFKEEKLQVLTEDAKTRSRQNCSGWIRSSMMFQVASWTFAEYLAAIRHDDFFASVERCLRPSTATPGTAGMPTKDRELMVKHKHFIAGGSARAMFVESSKDAVKLLQKAVLTRAANIAGDALGNVCGVDANTTNRLVALYDVGDSEARFETRIVSALAVRMLAVCSGPDVLLTLAAATRLHPSVAAWVLGSVAEGGLRYKLRGQPEATRDWKRQPVVFLSPETTVVSDRAQWYSPTEWSDGGYDALYLERFEPRETITTGEDTPRTHPIRIIFLQMTRSKNHTYAPEPFCSALRQLGENKDYVGSVELWFVVPQELLPKFACPVDQATFKRQVVDSAFPEAATRLDYAVRVAAVAYPMNHYAVAEPTPGIRKLLARF